MRTDSAIKNSSFAIFQKTIEVILSFVFRTALIKILGETYLGLSGLLTNLFSLLSLMELGMGSVVVYLMYKPLNNNKIDEVRALLKVYSKFYNIIGALIILIGVILIPFLPYIIKGYDSLTINVIPIYLLVLLNASFSYFLAYRRSLLDADQKSYINSYNYSVFNIIGTIFRITILIMLKNYILTLIISLLITILSNLSIFFKTNKLYPFLLKKGQFKLDKPLKTELTKRIGASIMHQFGNIIVTSTDNIIISSFIGLSVVGIYSNYTMITLTIYSMFSLIFCSITANVGNMKLNSPIEKSIEVFNKLFFLNFYLYFISCTVFGSMVNNLIYFWIGKYYQFNIYIVIAITINLYIQGMRNVIVTFINSSGLNYNTRFKSIFEALINLLISIILCKYLGVFGVIIGTIISFILVSVWFEPYILYKHWFKFGLKNYYLKYTKYFILMILQTIFLIKIVKIFNCTKFISFIAFGIGAFILSNILFIILFYRTKEFLYYYDLIKKTINNRKRLIK